MPLPIIIVSYDLNWPRIYEKESRLIEGDVDARATDAEAYKKLKNKLSEKYKYDRPAYTEAKCARADVKI